jgi:epoxide hydrolase 4
MDLDHLILRINGLNLHLVESGPADGELVILLHGFPEFWYGWRHQIEGLAEMGFHVVAPDQRGYNLSDKPGGIADYRVDRLAADVFGVMDAFGRDQACVAGHDWGAAVAWETALEQPGRVKKLAILNVPHPDVMQRFLKSNARQMLRSWYIFFFQLPWFPEWMLGRNGYATMQRMIRYPGKEAPFNEEDLQAYLQAWKQPGALTAMINWYCAAFRTVWHGPSRKGHGLVRRVQPPALIIWGKNDIALSSAMAEHSLQLCDNGRLVFYEDATHWVQHDRAKAVTRDLISFFMGTFP